MEPIEAVEAEGVIVDRGAVGGLRRDAEPAPAPEVAALPRSHDVAPSTPWWMMSYSAKNDPCSLQFTHTPFRARGLNAAGRRGAERPRGSSVTLDVPHVGHSQV